MRNLEKDTKNPGTRHTGRGRQEIYLSCPRTGKHRLQSYEICACLQTSSPVGAPFILIQSLVVKNAVNRGFARNLAYTGRAAPVRFDACAR